MLQMECICAPKVRVSGVSEDLAGSFRDVAWLLDGASSPRRFAMPHYDATWLTERLDHALRTVLLDAPACPLDVLIERAHERVGRAIDERVPDGDRARLHERAHHTTVSLVRRSGGTLEWLALQDSEILVEAEDGVTVFKDRRQDEFNAAYYNAIEMTLASGEGFAGKTFNALLDEMVDRERAWRNREGGFATFTGLACELTPVGGCLDVMPGARVLLASDGLARFWNLFGGDPSAALLQPLEEIVEYVREHERQDPHGRRFPRIGVHDDCAGVRLSLT